MNRSVRFGLRTTSPAWTTVYPGVVQRWRASGNCKPDYEITPESTIAETLSGWAYDFDFYMDICFSIEAEFGVRPPEGAWLEFLKSSQRWESISFQELSEFVAQHVEQIEVRPVEVLGKTCLPAACFAVLEHCAAGCEVPHVWPSHDIWAEVGATKIEQFWRRARWTFPALPPLRTTWLSKISSTFNVLAVITGLACLGSCLICNTAGPAAAALLLLATVMSAAIAMVIRDINNRLPDGIRTFRDLSLRLAEQQCAVP